MHDRRSYAEYFFRMNGGSYFFLTPHHRYRFVYHNIRSEIQSLINPSLKHNQDSSSHCHVWTTRSRTAKKTLSWKIKRGKDTVSVFGEQKLLSTVKQPMVQLFVSTQPQSARHIPWNILRIFILRTKQNTRYMFVVCSSVWRNALCQTWQNMCLTSRISNTYLSTRIARLRHR